MKGARSTRVAALVAGVVVIWVALLPIRWECVWLRMEAYLRSPFEPVPCFHVTKDVHDLGVLSRGPLEHVFEIHNDGPGVLELVSHRPC